MLAFSKLFVPIWCSFAIGLEWIEDIFFLDAEVLKCAVVQAASILLSGYR